MRILLVAVLLLLTAIPMVAPPGTPSAPAVEVSAATDNPDVPTLQVGDTWTHDAHAVEQDPTGNNVDAHTVIDTRVSEIVQVVQNATTYRVYNITAAGMAWSNGTASIPGTGTFPFRNMQGPVGGYTWLNRGDLALVRDREVSNLAGEVNLGFPFFWTIFLVDLDRTTVHFPAEEPQDFPLRVGETWDLTIGAFSTGTARIRIPLLGVDVTQPIDLNDVGVSRGWANQTEVVSVPAGTFDTFRLTYVRVGGAASLTDTRWWSPDAKNLARFEVHNPDPNLTVHTWTNLTAYALMPAIPVSVSLSPNPMGTCGDVTVNGTAGLANAPFEVFVTPTQAVYPGVTGPTGDYAVTFPVPAVNDSSPTTYDLASHGIAVSVTDGFGWAYGAATLEVLYPDIGVPAATLTVSSPRIAGLPVDITATAFEASGAPYGCTLAFTFDIDGSVIGTPTAPGIAAFGVQTRSANWPVATPGWHTATATLAPLVLETLLANNTASVSFFVEGPDLTLANLTVETAFYASTGAAGGRSGTIPANLGRRLAVGFEVANWGTILAASGTRVVAYNTSTEGGPASGAAFLDVVLPAISPGGAEPLSFTWDAPVTPGTSYFTIAADADGTLVETDETNNTFYVSVATDGPDLTPTAVRVTGAVVAEFPDPAGVNFQSPALLIPMGAAVSVELNVTNLGRVAANESYDVVFTNTSGPGGPASGPAFATASQPAGQAVGQTRGPILAAWTAPLVPGLYSVNLTADPGDSVVEISETNNTFVLTFDVSGPDLVPAGVTGTTLVSVGASVSLSSLAANTGPLGSAPFGADWILDNATAFASLGSAALPSGGSTWMNASWMAVSGNHSLCLVLDPSGAVAEIDETNNGACLAIEVREAPLTTLTVGTPQVLGTPVRIAATTPLSLSAQDRSGLGIQATLYSLDSGPVQTYSGPFSVAAEGTHNITFYSIDNLGGIEAANAASLLVDASGPVLAIAFETVAGQVRVTVTATDASGITAIRYRLDNGTWETLTGFTSVSFNVSAAGAHNVTAEADDALGNTAAPEVRTFDVPSPAAPGFPWFLLILALVIGLLLLLFAWRRRKKEPDTAEAPVASSPPEPEKATEETAAPTEEPSSGISRE